MKFILIAFLTVLIIFGSLNLSCDHATGFVPEKKFLYLILETNFHNDLVNVELNNKLLYQGRITTNHSVASAWAKIYKDYTEGIYTLDISMPDYDLYRQFEFYLSDTLTVGVRYDRVNNLILFSTFNGFFLRD